MSAEGVKVAFVHPDLGIGGAERLVVDAGVGLQNHGCQVTFFTSHHNPSHSFSETNDGTLNVVVHGDWIPRTIFGMGAAIMAYIRNIYLALCLLVLYGRYDVVISDQISISIPILLLVAKKVIFYCHFPDQLLSKRGGLLKRLYRLPLNKLEEYTTGMAHTVLVNSKFTQGVFVDTFPRLGRRLLPEVLYPAINLDKYQPSSEKVPERLEGRVTIDGKDRHIILTSINRFEEKKNIGLALDALQELSTLLPSQMLKTVRLVLAGGYDPRVDENRRVFDSLKEKASKYGLLDQVVFLPSFSEAERSWLLTHSRCVVYTPENEHFGIVPVEAMYARCPVVACNSGGPMESIVHGQTGFLCEPDALSFAESMVVLIRNEGDQSIRMGELARARVKEKYSLEAFSKRFAQLVIA